MELRQHKHWLHTRQSVRRYHVREYVVCVLFVDSVVVNGKTRSLKAICSQRGNHVDTKEMFKINYLNSVMASMKNIIN